MENGGNKGSRRRDPVIITESRVLRRRPRALIHSGPAWHFPLATTCLCFHHAPRASTPSRPRALNDGYGIAPLPSCADNFARSPVIAWSSGPTRSSADIAPPQFVRALCTPVRSRYCVLLQYSLKPAGAQLPFWMSRSLVCLLMSPSSTW
jgi:hypothetical protein